MFIVDAHQDIAYNHVCFGRDYRRAVYQTRRLEAQNGIVTPGSATLGLPDAILGRVAIVFATLFVSPRGVWQPKWDEPVYSDAREAYRHALRQIDYYHRLVDESDRLMLLQTQADLDAVLETWDDESDITQHKQGLAILMEGADPIIEPKQFEEWYERGVRIVGLAWSQTRYSAGTGDPGRLTSLGHELLDVLADFNAVLDLSHSAEEAFLEALDRYDGPIIASHSNPRKFCDSDRHLSDDMIRRLAERDGVMGIVMYNRFLDPRWAPGNSKTTVPTLTVVDAIDYVCQLLGSAAHVGLGSDFDGGFGAESIPAGFDTVTNLWSLGALLRERGYQEADIAAILGGNMLRKLRESLPD